MDSFFAVTSDSSTIRSVRVKPGNRLFTVIPKGATSFARVRAKPITAARMLFESIRLSTGCFAAIEQTLRILPQRRSEEHTSELQSRFGISYAVFCLKK